MLHVSMERTILKANKFRFGLLAGVVVRVSGVPPETETGPGLVLLSFVCAIDISMLLGIGLLWLIQ